MNPLPMFCGSGSSVANDLLRDIVKRITLYCLVWLQSRLAHLIIIIRVGLHVASCSGLGWVLSGKAVGRGPERFTLLERGNMGHKIKKRFVVIGYCIRV